MIGNDVVDLALARTESNWRREGFVQKLFTIHEQEIISTAKDTACAIWDLWSRKEAAYKILNREQGIRRFIPLKLECESLQPDSIVRCDEFKFYTRTAITTEYIHTIAVNHPEDFSRVISIPVSMPLVMIGKLPHINHTSGLKPVSVSHHGRFHFIVSVAT